MKLGTCAFSFEVSVHGSFHLSFRFSYFFFTFHITSGWRGVVILFRSLSFVTYSFLGFPIFLFITIVFNYSTALFAASLVGGQTGRLRDSGMKYCMG